jgi:hypothetical protein
VGIDMQQSVLYLIGADPAEVQLAIGFFSHYQRRIVGHFISWAME